VTTRRISVPEEGVERLFGSYDENLKHLQALFSVRIRTQGHELFVDGESPGVDNVERVVGQLSALMREGYKLGMGDVKTASDLAGKLLREAHVATVPGEGFGTSDHIRVSYATSTAELDRGLERLRKFLAAL
jgi:phosphate starvation-inducible protein PhoH